MEAFRRTATVLLLAFVVFTAGFVVGRETVSRPATPVPSGPADAGDPGAPPPPHQVVATYFHGNKRCDKCNAIERLSHKAVTELFPEAVERGELVWRVVNMDEPWNQHFKETYGLVVSSLVLIDMVDGEELDYAVLNRTWDLTEDENLFLAYVESEIEILLEEDDAEDEEE